MNYFAHISIIQFKEIVKMKKTTAYTIKNWKLWEKNCMINNLISFVFTLDSTKFFTYYYTEQLVRRNAENENKIREKICLIGNLFPRTKSCLFSISNLDSLQLVLSCISLFFHIIYSLKMSQVVYLERITNKLAIKKVMNPKLIMMINLNNLNIWNYVLIRIQ